MKAREVLAEAMSEAEFVDAILELAGLRGWIRLHLRPPKRGPRQEDGSAGRSRSTVAGDGQGFPDLLLLRGRRLVVAECKRQKGGRYGPGQELWLAAWSAIPGAEVYPLWRPSDWREIERVLR